MHAFEHIVTTRVVDAVVTSCFYCCMCRIMAVARKSTSCGHVAGQSLSPALAATPHQRKQHQVTYAHRLHQQQCRCVCAFLPNTCDMSPHPEQIATGLVVKSISTLSATGAQWFSTWQSSSLFVCDINVVCFAVCCHLLQAAQGTRTRPTPPGKACAP